MTTASARFPLVSPVGELDIGQGHILFGVNRRAFQTGGQEDPRRCPPDRLGRVMQHDSQPEAYYIHVWIRGIHPMPWRRFLAV